MAAKVKFDLIPQMDSEPADLNKLKRTISLIEDGHSADEARRKFQLSRNVLLADSLEMDSNLSLPYKSETMPIQRGRWYSTKKDTPTKMDISESATAVDDLVFLESQEDDSEGQESTLALSKDYIRQSLVDLMKTQSAQVQWLYDLESFVITAKNIDTKLVNATSFEKNVLFLMASFLKRTDLIPYFRRQGINPNFTDSRSGLSALHLSAYSGCLEYSELLVSLGAPVNCYGITPLHCAALGNCSATAKFLVSQKANITHTEMTKLSHSETPLHSAVRVRSLDCIKLFLEQDVNVNAVSAYGWTPLHIAADYGYSDCMKLLLDTGKCEVDLPTKERQNSSLHLAAEDGSLECLELLLKHGANPRLTNAKQQQPLHLAAKTCHECVEVLLKHGADPNPLDADERTPLHTAMSKIDVLSSIEIIHSLIKWKANVNLADKYGYTPLHVAALNELTDRVEYLILNGADVSARTKGGSTALSIISRKTPYAIPAISQVLDESITITDKHHSSKNLSLAFNFRFLLQNCKYGEASILETFVNDGQRQLLSHPLCQALLHLKWRKLKKLYLARLALCFLFVLLLSLYVLTALAYECYNDLLPFAISTRRETALCDQSSQLGSFLRSYPKIISIMWFCLAVMALLETVRKVFGMTSYRSFPDYFRRFQNVCEWFLIISVFAISFIYDGRTHVWQNHVGAIAVLCGWANLMFMVANLPVFGTYILMYNRVQKEFTKLFGAFFFLLFGFTVCFCVMFPRKDEFANPLSGMVKVIAMMAGDLDFDGFMEHIVQEGSNFLRVTALLGLALFIILIHNILMNLLVGIAVSDIQGLKKTADLQKLVGLTQLIGHIERALFRGCVPLCCVKLLKLTSIFHNSFRAVLIVKPLNPRECRLPKSVLRSGLEVAMNLKMNQKAGTDWLRQNRFSVQKDDELQELGFLVLKLTKEVQRLRESLHGHIRSERNSRMVENDEH